MSQTLRSGRARIVAVLAAFAVIVTVLGLAFGNAEAGSSVTPQSGPAGKVVTGTYQGKPQRLQTMLFQVDLNGETSYMFCIDISTTIQFGVGYEESTWNESAVTNLRSVARILSRTTATSTKDPVEIAAAQAAIWHFSDGFDLNTSDPKNDPAVVARYQALVEDAAANPVTEEPAGTLDISPATVTVAQGAPAFYDVATTSSTPLTIELSDASVSAHPATGDVCDTATTITTVSGRSRICLTSTGSPSRVTMTLRSGSAALNAGRVFIRPQRQKLIIGKAGAAQTTETVTASWTPNGRPNLTLDCPSFARPDAPAEFTASATDPEGTPVTLTWLVNGTDTGQTGERVSLLVAAGDRVSVVATDGAGLTVSADCVPIAPPDTTVPPTTAPATTTTAPTTTAPTTTVPATTSTTTPGSVPNRPPTVQLSCPDRLVWGTAATFVADGDDPDGDRLTYEWRIGDRVVDGVTGDTATLTLRAGESASVRATDSRGASSDVVRGECPGNSRPTVTLDCPGTVFYGEPTEFVAVGSDPEGDALTYRWSVNGNVDAQQTSDRATFAVNEGDRINVAAIDADGEASMSRTVQCRGLWRPTVTITCPAQLVWGETYDFVANGVSPDGDTQLTYTWYVNGTVVPGITAPRLTTTLALGDRLTVTATNSAGAVSAEAGADCAGNGRPEVALVCPEQLVFGRPSTFTATATDPDGDELAYEWRVNDTVVEGRTGPTAELTIAKGDRVSVTVGDGSLNSAVATSTCTGNSAPTVATVCPERVVLGEPATFGATGADDDGDSLTYTWTVNGTPVAGVTGPLATLTLRQGDVVAVTATDPTGAASASVTFDCSPLVRPKISIVCPANYVFGQPTRLRAAVEGTTADLAFTWAINGRIIYGENGPSLTTTLLPNDVLSVTAVGSNGLAADTVGAACTGRVPGDLPPVPPLPQVLSSTVYSAATQASTVAALPVTGGSTAVLVMIAVAALAAGLLLVRFGNREREELTTGEQ